MQTIFDTNHAVSSRILSLIDELSAGCDTEFDTVYDDLEREFAELRLQLGNA
jgi:hypothetical protein